MNHSLLLSSMKRLDGMLVHRRVTLGINFAGTHLHTWMERRTVRFKFLAQELNRTQCTRPGLEPEPLDPVTSALTMRPPRLHNVNDVIKSISGDK